MSLNITGLSGMDASTPAGATIERTSWHVAGSYGPGPEFPTEADAVHAAIEAHLRHVEAYVAAHAPGYVEAWPYSGRVPSVDLRWKMKWEQGTPDANGQPTTSAGIETTVRRTTYESVEEAQAHLTRILASLARDPYRLAEFHAHRSRWLSEPIPSWDARTRVLCEHDLTERCHPTSVPA
jgi:hypothetical protein